MPCTDLIKHKQYWGAVVYFAGAVPLVLQHVDPFFPHIHLQKLVIYLVKYINPPNKTYNFPPT